MNFDVEATGKRSEKENAVVSTDTVWIENRPSADLDFKIQF